MMAVSRLALSSVLHTVDVVCVSFSSASGCTVESGAAAGAPAPRCAVLSVLSKQPLSFPGRRGGGCRLKSNTPF